MNVIKTPLLVISIFKNIIKDSVFSSFIDFLSNLSYSSDFDLILNSYSEFISLLYKNSLNQNLYEYVKKLIYSDENIISNGCASCIKDNRNILTTAEYELSLIYNLLNYSYEKVISELNSKFSACNEIISHIPSYNTAEICPFSLSDIISSYEIIICKPNYSSGNNTA